MGAIDFGPVRRWRDGDILYAENDFALAAFVVTDDHRKLGTLGFHGPNEVCVEYIGRDQARKWDHDI